MVYTWDKDYVKYNGHDVEPLHIFISGSERTGKYHLVKVIYNAISKLLLHHCKGPKTPRVLLRGPIGISAVNIGGTTTHSCLGIKPGTKLLSLNDKSKDALRNRLSEVKFLIIGEISMVSSDLWTDIESRLRGIFMMIPEKVFSGILAMTIADLLQLPLVREKLIFSQFSAKDSMKHFLGLQP